MTNITGGIVSIEDGTKAAADYAPARKVRVELHFDIPKDGDSAAHLDAVSAIAQAKVTDLLTVTRGPTPLELSDKDKKAIDAGVMKRPAGRPKKPEPPVTDETVANAVKDVAKELKVPAASLADELELPAEVADELEEVPEITDDQLIKAITVKNGAIKNPAKIRELKDEFVPKDGNVYQFKDIAQKQRAGFLKKLESLTA